MMVVGFCIDDEKKGSGSGPERKCGVVASVTTGLLFVGTLERVAYAWDGYPLLFLF